MKKSIAFAALFAVAVFAQEETEPKMGIRAGVNFSSSTMSYGGFEIETDNIIGFHAGVVKDIPISGDFYFMTGAMLSLKGGLFKDEYWDDEYRWKSETTYNIYYLQVPLMAVYKVPLNESAVVRAEAGAYVAFGLSGTAEDKEDSPYDGSRTESIDIYKDAKLDRVDYGFSFGGGVEFGNFYVGISYEIGIGDLSATQKDCDEDGECYGSIPFTVNHSTFGITAGYNF